MALGAACLVVGRLVARTLGIARESNFVQYDALFGPEGRTVEKRHAKKGCYCVTRSTTIDQVRKRRFKYVITASEHRLVTIENLRCCS